MEGVESYRAKDQQQCIVFLFLFDFNIIFAREMGIATTAYLEGTKLLQLIPAVGDQPALLVASSISWLCSWPSTSFLVASLCSLLCWVRLAADGYKTTC
jgi:hypothetical protein